MSEGHPRINSRILFASCNSQHHEQVLWESILSRNANAFVWGGDAIYADIDRNEATPEILAKLYNEQKEHAGYKRLLDTKIPILGVLDDHDYGINNGDSTYRYRKESGIALACDFLGQEGTAMCERAKKGLGVYGVKVMDFSRPEGKELMRDDEAGLDPDVPLEDYDESSTGDISREQQSTLSNKSVAIFLLDVRSNRTPYTKKGLIEKAEYDGDFLGETQWEWLEAAIGRSTASVNIIVQGLQVHADRAGPVETWSRFPTAQHRLYQLLLQKHVKAPIIVSGDVHHAQMLRKDCQFIEENRISPREPPKMLLEVTTSGMTHSWGSEICARPQLNVLCRMSHSKWAAGTAMKMAQFINIAKVWTEVLILKQGNEGARSGMQFTLDRNYAELDFDWAEQSVTVRILGQDVDGQPLLSSTWSFDSLSGGNVQLSPEIADDKIFLDSHNNLHQNDSFNDTHWVCLEYRGNPSPAYRIIGVVLPVTFGLSVSFAPFVVIIIAIVRLYRRVCTGRSKTKQA